MRGKPVRCQPCVLPFRIIPAHAGQTVFLYEAHGALTDHPRACGANPIDGGEMLNASGSSPRMRGKLGVIKSMRFTERIIPAHAGQTAAVNAATHSCTDHPRACGANGSHLGVGHRFHGSSPRMRGKRYAAVLPGASSRIIPAHAGQTDCAATLVTCKTDHPRACGANLRAMAATVRIRGSSPRMRGKPIMGAYNPITRRIIPAQAGQTCKSSTLSQCPADHPRACGANHVHINNRLSILGSSPRMRGKRGNYAKTRAATRIIPAHAGQTRRF